MEGLEILKKKIKEAPVTSGVYLFKNKKDQPFIPGYQLNRNYEFWRFFDD